MTTIGFQSVCFIYLLKDPHNSISGLLALLRKTRGAKTHAGKSLDSSILHVCVLCVTSVLTSFSCINVLQ